MDLRKPMANAKLKKLVKEMKSCGRCGLHIQTGETTCSYCGELSDDELKVFLKTVERERSSFGMIGRLFLFVGLVLALSFFIAIFFD